MVPEHEEKIKNVEKVNIILAGVCFQVVGTKNKAKTICTKLFREKVTSSCDKDNFHTNNKTVRSNKCKAGTVLAIGLLQDNKKQGCAQPRSKASK